MTLVSAPLICFGWHWLLKSNLFRGQCRALVAERLDEGRLAWGRIQLQLQLRHQHQFQLRHRLQFQLQHRHQCTSHHWSVTERGGCGTVSGGAGDAQGQMARMAWARTSRCSTKGCSGQFEIQAYIGVHVWLTAWSPNGWYYRLKFESSGFNFLLIGRQSSSRTRLAGAAPAIGFEAGATCLNVWVSSECVKISLTTYSCNWTSLVN